MLLEKKYLLKVIDFIIGIGNQMIYKLSIFSLMSDVTILCCLHPRYVFETIENPSIYTTELLQTLNNAKYMISLWKLDGTWVENITVEEFTERYKNESTNN